jgi:Eco57I restriction-modification methylase
VKFDVVIGNPPYQSGNRPIWKKFVDVAQELAPVVAFVTPRAIVNGAYSQTAPLNIWGKLRDHTTYLNYSATDHFPQVTKQICAWIYDVNHTGPTRIVDEDGVEFSACLPDYSHFPYHCTQTIWGFFNKLYQYPDKMTEWHIITDNQKDSGSYIVLPKNRFLYLTSIRYTENLAADDTITARWLIIYPVKGAGVESYINSRLFHYVFRILGGDNSGSSSGLMRKIPAVDWNRIYTDAELYALLNLTDAERADIESTN